MGIGLLRGRSFTWDDDNHASCVAIISENLAAQLFPRGDALGQHLDIVTEPKWHDLQIVGIVTNTSFYDIRKHRQPMLYFPQYGAYMGNSELLVQTKGASMAMLGPIRQVVKSLGREYVPSATTIEEQIDHSLLRERITALLSAFFGGIALLLAAIGLYGLMAYSVTRRSREIGIRIALGAQRSAVLWMILRETLVLAIIGLAIGLPCAITASRLIASMLYGIGANDPATLIAVALLLMGVAALAGFIPARRAMRLDPMAALRHE